MLDWFSSYTKTPLWTCSLVHSVNPLTSLRYMVTNSTPQISSYSLLFQYRQLLPIPFACSSSHNKLHELCLTWSHSFGQLAGQELHIPWEMTQPLLLWCSNDALELQAGVWNQVLLGLEPAQNLLELEGEIGTCSIQLHNTYFSKKPGRNNKGTSTRSWPCEFSVSMHVLMSRGFEKSSPLASTTWALSTSYRKSKSTNCKLHMGNFNNQMEQHCCKIFKPNHCVQTLCSKLYSFRIPPVAR